MNIRQQSKSFMSSKINKQQKNEFINNLLRENGFYNEKWTIKASKNLFKIFSLSKHFSSLQEEKYRLKNIEYVKNLNPEDFTGKLQILNNEKNYLEFLKNPDDPKFEMVILFF